MITDALLDMFFGVFDWLLSGLEAATDGLPTDPFSDVTAAITGITSLFGIMANFVHLGVIGAALTFVATWETAFIATKLILKAYRLIPFKFS